jgi:acyl-CoA thioester hydrolase
VFRFAHPIEVRFRDIDLLGHVNNAVYLSYLEQARAIYLHRLGLRQDHPTTVLVRNEIDYRRPVHLGDAVTVAVRVARIGNKSLEFQYEVRVDDVTCAIASSVHVWFDFATNQSVRVPNNARAVIESFEALISSHV